MLILTRKSGEGIRVGDEIKVVILEIKGNQVRVGIEAPQNIQVHRDEVHERIRSENITAASVTPAPDYLQRLFKLWTDKK
ncbi:MAG: carbon storage regulator CsrA [Nitrospira sp.]|nr:carbon storage regulator CsrA [Nitrospira sp.]